MAVVNMDFDLVNQIEELDRLNLKLNHFCSRVGFDSKCFGDICLALEEIFSNIVQHGHKDGSTHRISFNLSLEHDILTVCIKDDGIPFDPSAAPAPDVKCPLDQRQIGGLGVYLVKKVMDEISYRRCDDQNMTILKKSVGTSPCAGQQASRNN